MCAGLPGAVACASACDLAVACFCFRLRGFCQGGCLVRLLGWGASAHAVSGVPAPTRVDDVHATVVSAVDAAGHQVKAGAWALYRCANQPECGSKKGGQKIMHVWQEQRPNSGRSRGVNGVDPGRCLYGDVVGTGSGQTCWPECHWAACTMQQQASPHD